MKTTKNEADPYNEASRWCLLKNSGDGQQVITTSLRAWQAHLHDMTRSYLDTPWVKIAEGTKKEMKLFEKLTKEPSDEE